ncbi:hypothetical protein FZC35_01645 [Candidatus Cytomitobacter indipagum]|uniref:NusB/RsmB/TIM44 domain-containing protein n=1 Tax=Candidatus Cytomitobacter indipagum TaxID=2601575 RepID=A0A5C0UEJ6_9PROT|nr:transcription antitermination factor NusB [Candidatus Cytomitobacter indipagum]QEK38073.1 hypothetical protein FZC35_01645 [Candidatus Cytomitobacter indipagum]
MLSEIEPEILKQTRFAKVQAIYQFLLLDNKNEVLMQFHDRSDEDLGDRNLFFKDINKIVNSLDDIEDTLMEILDNGKWRWENTGCIVKSLLICGSFDLSNCENKKQVVDHYISIARIFGEEESIAFLHSNLENVKIFLNS